MSAHDCARIGIGYCAGSPRVFRYASRFTIQNMKPSLNRNEDLTAKEAAQIRFVFDRCNGWVTQCDTKSLNHNNRFEVWPQIQNIRTPDHNRYQKRSADLKDITWVMRGAKGQHQSKTTSRSYTPENPLDLRNSYLGLGANAKSHRPLWKLCRPDWSTGPSPVNHDQRWHRKFQPWRENDWAHLTTFSRPGTWVISAYTWNCDSINDIPLVKVTQLFKCRRSSKRVA